MKNRKKILIITGVLITFCLIFIIVYKKYKEPKIRIDLAYESIIPSSPSVLIRLDDLDNVWSDFKETNFYYQLNTFLSWLWKKTPSGLLGYSKDIRDIQEDIGFKLDEKNILAFLGKKILIAMWLENVNDKKVLIISDLKKDSVLLKEFKRQTAYKTRIDKYKEFAICTFGKHKYWCLLDNKLIISNDIGTIRKVIGLAVKVSSDRVIPGGSIVTETGFQRSISRIVSNKYIYINTQKLFGRYQLVVKEIGDMIISIEFKDGLLLKSCISLSQPARGKKPKKIESLIFAPDDVSFYCAGNTLAPRFISNNIFDKTLLGDELGYFFWPGKFMLYYEVKDREAFLSKFEKIVNPLSKNNEGGIFKYKVPYLGNKWKYFFIEDRFVICTPPEFSKVIKFFVTERKKLLAETESFKRLKIPSKSNEIFYINFSNICRVLYKEDYLKFIQPSGGYTIWTSDGPENMWHIPMVDLSRSQWEEIFSVLHKSISKKINAENEKITRINLLYLREALHIYKTKTNRYPVKLDSLIDEYLDEIPQELLTKSNNVSIEIDGSGGWFYKNGQVSLNVFGKDSSGVLYTCW
ncbi:MAG: hypothetical protein JW983_05485 [Elusimicrobia bacterium]|nr:hypothetical protein [Elusimicrobiota bacterium]